MRDTNRRCLAAALLAGCLVAGGGSLAATASAAAPVVVRAWSDLRPTQTDAAVLAEDAGVRKLCPAKARTPRRLSLDVAVRDAQRFVNRAAAPMRKLRLRSEYRTTDGLRRLAAGYAAGGSPMGVLAVMLRQHELAPKDPNPLVSAAGLLAQAGMPDQALALLDRADRLRGRLDAPLGISGTAIALNARGFTELALGRYSAARKALEQAVKLAPLLSEARTNLSAADVCAIGGRVIDKGRHRHGPAKPPTKASLLLAPVTFTVDVRFPVPASSIASAYAAEVPCEDPVSCPGPAGRLELRLLADERVQADRYTAALARWSSHRHTAAQSAVFDAVGAGDVIPGELTPYKQQFRTYSLYFGEGRFDQDAFGGSPVAEGCAGYAEAYSRYLQAYSAHIPEIERWAQAYANAAYSYAAAFTDDDARAIIIARAMHEIDHVEGAVAGGVYKFSSFWDPLQCSGPPEGAEVVAPAPVIPDHPCPFKPLELDIGPFLTLGLSCESVSADLHNDGPMQAFSRWSKNFKDHTTTYMMGVRATTGGPVGMTTETGAYITESTRTGRVIDAGFKGPETTLSPSRALSLVSRSPSVTPVPQFGGFQASGPAIAQFR